MPPPPPLKDVLESLQQCVLPGAGGAALATCAFLVLGRWAAATGTAVAAAAAFVWGNFALTGSGAEPPGWANTSRLIPWAPAADAPGYQWLPRAALVLMAVGLVSRWAGLLAARYLRERHRWGPALLVWLPRLAAVLTVSGWLILGAAAQAAEWAGLRWVLAAATLLLWFVLDSLARTELGAEVHAHLAAAFLAGGVVLLYSHNAKFMELAVLVGSAVFGIAVATGAAMRYAPGGTALYASGAIPAAALFLPGLLLGTRPAHAENKVPALCFWLVALAPLLLAPLLVPRVARQNRWVLLALRVLLVLAPLAAAVLLAGRHEKFPYEEGPQW